MVPKKPHQEKEPPAGEKKSTAESKPEPQAAMAAEDMPTPRAPPPPPGTAGTPVTVTPYTVSGNAYFYMVGTTLCGSEEAALQSLKNLLFKPAIPS